MVCCVVCGEWVHSLGNDRLDICDGCWPNFAGASPALDQGAVATLEAADPAPPPAHVPASPTARAALEAFLTSDHQMTPRQVEAMAQLAEAWRRQAEDAR